MVNGHIWSYVAINGHGHIYYISCHQLGPAGEHPHIAWECAGNKKALCGHINEEWSDMKKTLIKFDDEKAPTVLFKEFQKQLVYDKTGKVILNKKGNEVIFSVIVTMCQQITRKIYTI